MKAKSPVVQVAQFGCPGFVQIAISKEIAKKGLQNAFRCSIIVSTQANNASDCTLKTEQSKPKKNFWKLQKTS